MLAVVAVEQLTGGLSRPQIAARSIWAAASGDARLIGLWPDACEIQRLKPGEIASGGGVSGGLTLLTTSQKSALIHANPVEVSIAAGSDVLQCFATLMALDLLSDELEAHRQHQTTAYHLSRAGG